MLKTKWFDLLVSVKEMKKGSKIQLKVDANGVPLDVFWKRRYEDGDTLKKTASPKANKEPVIQSDEFEKKEQKRTTKKEVKK